ncbi:ParA family protein, partial [Enterococcus hirae]|uniref:ParA family protein n=1 Tax=Enterococcus hirae TaxID=1354 RepID=UPI0025579C8B
MVAKKYVIGNFKGGVGKSTCAQMLGFESAVNEGKRTLIIDLDMQGNTSDVMNLTHMNFTNEEGGGEGEPIVYENTVTDVLINNLPPKEAVYKVINNLYILPADMSFEMYDDWIKDQYNDSLSQFKYMKEKLEPLFDEFDVIYLDVPPFFPSLLPPFHFPPRRIVHCRQTFITFLQKKKTTIKINKYNKTIIN